MKEFENMIVVQSNILINATHSMSVKSLKLFQLIISLREKGEKKVKVPKKMILDLLVNSKSEKKYNIVKQQIKNFIGDCSFIIDENEDNEDGGWSIESGLLSVKWENKAADVFFELTDWLVSYLEGFNGNYTSYFFEDISKLEGKYSLSLYQILMMKYKQYKAYNKGTNVFSVKIGVDELRKVTGTVEKYERFGNFWKKVIEDSIAEINKKTSLNVVPEKVKRSIYITDVLFSISEKQTINSKNNEEGILIKTREEKEAETALQAAKANKSKYTHMLIENGLLFVNDILNTNLMARLWVDVYGAYDEIESKYGEGSIEKHISLIATRRSESGAAPITDLASYLFSCLEIADRKKEFSRYKKNE